MEFRNANCELEIADLLGEQASCLPWLISDF